MNARSSLQSIRERAVNASPWVTFLYSNPKGLERPNIPKTDFLAAFRPLMPVEGRKSDGLVPSLQRGAGWLQSGLALSRSLPTNMELLTMRQGRNSQKRERESHKRPGALRASLLWSKHLGL